MHLSEVDLVRQALWLGTNILTDITQPCIQSSTLKPGNADNNSGAGPRDSSGARKHLFYMIFPVPQWKQFAENLYRKGKRMTDTLQKIPMRENL